MVSQKFFPRSVSRRTLLQGAGVTATSIALTSSQVAGGAQGISRSSQFARRQDAERITFWVISSFTPDEEAPIFQAAQQYQEATGVEVVVESTQASDLRNKLTTAVLGGEGPDVVAVDSAWNAGLAAAEIISDVTDRFAGMEDQFFSGPVESGRYLDRQFAVPWYTNNVALYYNKAMFADAGLDGPPETWEELVEMGKILTHDDQYGLMLGMSGFGSFLFWPFAFQNGATLISEDGTTAEFGSEAGLEAWKFYSDLYLTHKIVPEDIKSATTAWDQLFAPFIQERVAMMMSGDWATFAIEEGNPELDYGVAPLPKGKEAATVIGGYNLAIPTTSDNVDPAWDFIEWLVSEEQEWILQGYSRIQARQDIVGSEYAEENPNLEVFIQQSEVGRARASVPEWDEIENTIMAEAWDSVILGEATPEEALDRAVEETNEVLADS